MDSIGDITFKTVSINAVAGDMPFFMTGSISHGGVLPANNVERFTIDYFLYDIYGNPMANRSIWISTNLSGEQIPTLQTSDSNGLIRFYYGPKTSVLSAKITASAYDNASVTNELVAQFITTGPTNMVLAITPQTMASRDIPTSQPAQVVGKVTDLFGNPVPGEIVTFEIVSPIAYIPANATTGDPSFNSATTVLKINATTNNDGNALIDFYPGLFITNQTDPNYSSTATGSCNVQATWKSHISPPIKLEWKNYPYFSVTVNATPQTVRVNETVDVTIRVKGDGWAFQPKPIDAMLVIDRSGSMGRNNVAPGVTRMQAAKNAAKTFVTKINAGSDRVGLVSYSYENSVTLDAPLGTDFTTINSRINGLTDGGGTAMREGFRIAIQELVSNPKPSAVRAVILMTDGNWNNGGSPLAVGKGYQDTTWVTNNRDTNVGTKYHGFSSLASDFEDEDYRWYPGMGGTIITGNNVQVVRSPVSIDETSGVQTGARTYRVLNNVDYCQNGQFTKQNMSIYAKTNNIRLYTISFAQNVPVSERTALTVLANSTGGFYRHAPTETDLANVYQEIAGDLNDVAGVNAIMDLSFKNVEVNSTPMSGGLVFGYIPVTTTTWPNATVTHKDQSSEWIPPDYQLKFNIGTLHINETWQTQYRFRVKTTGLIKLLGSESKIMFNNGTESMNLPEIYITAIPNTTPVGLQSGTLSVTNLVPQSGNFTDNVPMQWNLNSTGVDMVTETYYYKFGSDPSWKEFGSTPNIPSTNGLEISRIRALDVKKFPPGEYRIKVIASVPGIPPAEDYGAFTIPPKAGTISIWLK
jgi:Mg-chelatase subunit ChlD